MSRFDDIGNESLGCIPVNENIVCIGCMFANDPKSAYCDIYKEGSRDKPNSIYFDGASCKYRREYETE